MEMTRRGFIAGVIASGIARGRQSMAASAPAEIRTAIDPNLIAFLSDIHLLDNTMRWKNGPVQSSKVLPQLIAEINLWGQTSGRTSFLPRFRHVLRRYPLRRMGLSDEVSQWRCRRETRRSGRSSDLTPADACAQTSSDFAPRSDLWSGHNFGFAVGESPLRSVASAAHLLSMPSCTTTKPRPTASAPNCAAFGRASVMQTLQRRSTFFATKEMRRPAASPKRTEDGASPCMSNPKEMRHLAVSSRRTEDGASPCVSNPKEMRHLAASSKRTAKAEADRLRAELRRLTESV